MAVVDPGVGSRRRGIIIEAEIQGINQETPKRALFVGPDNGLLSIVAPKENRIRVWEITRLDALPRFETCATFDGRNIFAPTAALLASGAWPSEFGKEIEQGRSIFK